jgi:hypothetical protein
MPLASPVVSAGEVPAWPRSKVRIIPNEGAFHGSGPLCRHDRGRASWSRVPLVHFLLTCFTQSNLPVTLGALSSRIVIGDIRSVKE